ncbi:restriction endonuclease subunit S [Methylibium sp.]|uniref:restriction endonuclease subunit S n=1 Tax=Methylibium sp. TaxID=2067992 RepID=UPI0025D92098|nr:restriction endonuclease subunit S [Methylibium sp.]
MAKRFSGGTPDKNTQEYWHDGTIPWLNSGAVNQALITEPSTFISESGFAYSSAKWIPAGALVMALAGQGKTKGMAAQLAISSTCNQSMAAIVPAAEMQPRFLLWWLQSNYQNIRNMAGGDMRDGLNLDLLGEIPCPIPRLDEQTAISTFLDRETSKIDALVKEQKRLIELLKEKRQAVISQAVTKGLDPDVPMKDSGVEWLGEVPAHWDVWRVKDAARLESGHTPSKQVPEYWEDCDIPWVSLNDSKQLAVVDYISETAVCINELGLANSSARMLPTGAVVFTRDATIGLAAITSRPMAVSQHLIAWCPGERINALYLLRVFNVMKDFLDAATFGATIKTIGMADVKNLVTPLPQVSEQREIAAFIGVRKSEFDALISEAESATALLGERRAALISAAVTGKIDVRSLIPQPEAATA